MKNEAKGVLDRSEQNTGRSDRRDHRRHPRAPYRIVTGDNGMPV